MKKITIPMLLLALVCLFGCAGRLITPVYGPPVPGSTNPPVIIGYIPNTNAVNAAGTVGQVGQVVPPPGNWIISGLATLFAAGLGVFAKIKSDKANRGQTILNAVIAGVEAAGDSSKAVKESISTHVAATGKTAEFDKNVQEVSNTM
jgi:hypothetical protein